MDSKPTGMLRPGRSDNDRKSVNEDNRFAEHQLNTPVTKDEAAAGIALCNMINTDIVPELRKIKKYEDADEYLLTHLLLHYEFERLSAQDFKDVIGSKQNLVALKSQLQEMRIIFASAREELKNGDGITRQQRRVMSKHNAVVYSLLVKIVRGIDYTKAFRDVPSMSIDKCTQFLQEKSSLWDTLTSDPIRLLVPWNVFFKGMSTKLLDIPSPTEEKALKRLIDINSTDHVSIKSFDNFLRAFGPLKNCLVNVTNLFSQRWFHGFLSPYEGEKLLINEPVGTYLVRISQSRTDSFALQFVRQKEKVDTVGITCVCPKVVSIEVSTPQGKKTKNFATIQDLLTEFKEILVKPFKTKLLTQPWFHGSMSFPDAKTLLSQKGVPGTFLFHFLPSQSILQTYSCSFNNSQGQCVQIVLEKSTDGLRVQNDPEFTSTSFPSLTAFIQSHAEILRFPYDDERVPKLICDYDDDDEDEELEPWTWSTFGPIENSPTVGQLPTSSPNPAIYCSTRSNYPAGTGGDSVFCDVFRVSVTNNRCVVAVGDGCNWGWRPRKAAEAATKAVIDNLNNVDFPPPEDSWVTKSKLLESFKLAQNAILEQRNENFEPGTTTLLSGMLTKVKSTALKQHEYAFVFASVGDCKAFHWNPLTEQFTDITSGNRGNTRDASDCGGRLGPQLKGDLPDLRNLMTCFYPCNEGDIILVMSDGVHDNLDPESLGDTPKDSGSEYSNYASWDDCSPAETEKIKSSYMCHKMGTICNALREKTPKSFVDALVNYTVNVTLKTREFMENSPQAPEPACHKDYPGKMDHVTCVGLRVGPFIPSGVVRTKRKKSTKSALTKKPASSVPDIALIKKDPFLALQEAYINQLPPLAVRKFRPELSCYIKTEKESGPLQTILFSPPKRPSPLTVGDYRTSHLSSSSGALSPYTASGAETDRSDSKPTTSHQLTESEVPRPKDRQFVVPNISRTTQSAPLNRAPSRPDSATYEDIFAAAALTFPILGPNLNSLLPQKTTKPGGHFYRIKISPTRTTCALCASFDETQSSDSKTAAKKLADSLESHLCAETKATAMACLAAVEAAHRTIQEKNKSGNLGLTALTLSWLSDLQNGRVPSKWVLSAANVGHNKIFHWISAKKILVDLTPSNFVAPIGSTEEHYSVGANSSPTKIFQYSKIISMLIEDEKDIIIVLSHNVYHHFDPESTGKAPKEYFEQYHAWKGQKRWEKVPYNDPIRHKIRTTAIQDSLSTHSNLTTKSIVQILSQATQNPSNKPPRSEVKKGFNLSKTSDLNTTLQVPKPLSGGTCIALRVGEAQEITTIPPSEKKGFINNSQDNSVEFGTNSTVLSTTPSSKPHGNKDLLRSTVFVDFVIKK